MNPDHWRKIEDIFQQAADLEGPARAAFLDTACNGDPDLRAEVDSLLDSAGLSLIAPAISEAAGEVTGLATLTGQQLGPYRILDRIGEGGMGAVFRAQRADGQFEQTVAIKMIRPGVAGVGHIERFLAERSILAQLQHPFIARLIDGGIHNGSPSLVMEHVDGQPIDAYCREWSLNVQEKLELFLKVCDAVQHAHAALIVHRDIKPSNIFVTPNGIPKLLDFGIAKLVAHDTDAIQTSAPLMTPDYASPEQVRGESITIASDVYSLGIVLYELLTGQRPYKLKSYSPAEIQQQVCNATIPAPSSLVQETTRIKRHIEGDLDNILLMALRKEPNRRYGSVAQLAEDICRHLAGHTVIARPDTLRYRASKFVLRNRLTLGLGLLLVATFTAGVYFTVREGLRTQRRFSEVRTLANSLLTEIEPLAASIVGTTEMRKLLLDKSVIYLESLTSEAGSDTELTKELARAWHRVGDIQGHSRLPNLGLFSESLASHRKALDMEEALYAKRSRDSELRRSMALGYAHIADLYSRRGDSAKAADALDRAFSFKDDLNPESFVDIHISRSRAHFFAGDLEASVDILKPALPPALKLKDPARAINIYYLSAVSTEAMGQPTVALASIQKGLALSESRYVGKALSPAELNRYALLNEFHGTLLYNSMTPSLEKPCEARDAYAKALEPKLNLFRGDPRSADTFVSAVSLLQLYSDAQAICGDPRAVESAEKTIELYELAQRKPHANVNFYIAYAHLHVGRLSEAKRRLKGLTDEEGNAQELLAQIAFREGRNPDGLNLLKQARTLREPLLNKPSFQRRGYAFRQARNLYIAITHSDTTPGLQQQALQHLSVYPQQNISPAITRLRAQLR